MIKKKIIIDTDPGQDDAVALLLALASKELEILGITCVAGNVPLSLTSENARKILELTRYTEIPVFAGADRPIKRTLVTAEHVHGKTGIDGPVLEKPKIKLQSKEAIEFIIETILSYPKDEITLCTLGPLTNIGLAFQREPRIKTLIKEIIMMGGGFFEGGNITPAAEFNIYVDPEAAAEVLVSGIPITMLPLDVTHKALTSRSRIESFRKIGNKAGIATAEMLDFFERFDVEKYGSEGGPLHDPNVIAYLLRPEFYEGKYVNVEIEVGSDLTRGMTVVDWWNVTTRKKNVYYIDKVKDEEFFNFLIERIKLL
ncbi:MAG: nucleoside hydrolase [Rhodobacteraceae bacterium]|jgi:purine nucleosidase|nr:MAG: nucleoside hydrolase [Paracoccaceae bacterium]|tara:strand:- start:1360 stop:2298 length:939 start_codon:yes stop_codon:yes gene_type:complete